MQLTSAVDELPAARLPLPLAMLASDVGRALSEQLSMHSMLQGSVDAILRRLSVTGVHLWTAEVDGRLDEHLCAGSGAERYGDLTNNGLSGSEIGWIANQRTPLIVENVCKDARFADREWFEQSGNRAFVGFPLISCGRLFGVLAVLAPGLLDEAASQTLKMISTQIAVAMHRDTVLQSHQQVSQDLLTLTRRAPIGIVCVDTQRRVTGWNAAAERLFGWARDEVIGKVMPALPASREAWDRALAASLNGETSPPLDTRGRCKDGTSVAVQLTVGPLKDGDGHVVGATVFAADRRHHERAELCRSVAQQALRVIGHCGDAVACADSLLAIFCRAFGWRYGQMWMINDQGAAAERIGSWHGDGAAREIVDARGSHVSLQSDAEQLPWMHHKHVRVRVAAAAQHADQAWSAAGIAGARLNVLDVPIRAGDRTLGALEFYGAEIHPPDTQLTAVLEAVAQQTGQCIARMHVEEALRRTEAELRQSKKMQSIGQLAGGIAHDFNNLLTVILGYSDLAMNAGQDGRLDDFLPPIREAGQRAAALTKQLLAFSRKQVVELAILDLNEVVSGMERMLRRLIGEHIELTTTLEPLLYRIKADSAQIEQVLLNLSVNARDAMGEGGRLHIETSNADRLPESLRRGAGIAPGPFACLAVRDTGCGMDESTRQRVFEPFFTTKEAGKGTGMGLATIQSIIEACGGQIDLQSTPGEGSRFRIYLPRTEESLATANVDAAAPQFPSGTESILVVEDESVVRTVTCRILESRGYRVLEASDAAQAHDLWRGQREPVDLLLTDVVMPGQNGLELASELQRSNDQLKVLFMSGYTDSTLLADAERAWDRPLLHKPFTSATLTQRVREVLDDA